MINNVSGTNFGCGHCRDAANKFIKVGVSQEKAKQLVQDVVRGSEDCYSEAHTRRAGNYDLKVLPKLLETLFPAHKLC